MKKNGKRSYSGESLWITNSTLVVVAVIVFFLLDNCHGKKEAKMEANYQKELKVKSDSIDLLKKNIANWESRKAIIDDENTTDGKLVTAIIVDANDDRPSSMFLKKQIERYPVEITVLVPCPDINQGLIDQIAETNKLLDNSINICLNKQYGGNDPIIMVDKDIQIRTFLLNPPPSINYTSPSYTEYLTNPYRDKAKNSFWWGVGFGGGSALVYGISELIGHPKYFDDTDNSNAKGKSNLILGLRIGSGALATASLIEFGRTIYFHHMEGKFIVGPNKIGLYVNLDK